MKDCQVLPGYFTGNRKGLWAFGSGPAKPLAPTTPCVAGESQRPALCALEAGTGTAMAVIEPHWLVITGMFRVAGHWAVREIPRIEHLQKAQGQQPADNNVFPISTYNSAQSGIFRNFTACHRARLQAPGVL